MMVTKEVSWQRNPKKHPYDKVTGEYLSQSYYYALIKNTIPNPNRGLLEDRINYIVFPLELRQKFRNNQTTKEEDTEIYRGLMKETLLYFYNTEDYLSEWSPIPQEQCDDMTPLSQEQPHGCKYQFLPDGTFSFEFYDSIVTSALKKHLSDWEINFIDSSRICDILIKADLLALWLIFMESMMMTSISLPRRRISHFLSDNWEILSDHHKEHLRNAYWTQIPKNKFSTSEFISEWEKMSSLKKTSHYPKWDDYILALNDEISSSLSTSKKQYELTCEVRDIKDQPAPSDSRAHVSEVIASILNNIFSRLVPKFAWKEFTSDAIRVRLNRSTK
jgi:hypothetical protein